MDDSTTGCAAPVADDVDFVDVVVVVVVAAAETDVVESVVTVFLEVAKFKSIGLPCLSYSKKT